MSSWVNFLNSVSLSFSHFVFGEDSEISGHILFLLIAINMVDLIGSSMNFIQEVLQLFY